MGGIISFFRREKTINYREILQQIDNQIKELEEKKKQKEQSRRSILLKTYVYSFLFWSLWTFSIYLEQKKFFQPTSFFVQSLPVEVFYFFSSISISTIQSFISSYLSPESPSSDPASDSPSSSAPPPLSPQSYENFDYEGQKELLLSYLNVIKYLPVICIPLLVYFFTRIVNAWTSKQIHRYDTAIQELVKSQKDKVDELKASINFDTVRLIQQYETKLNQPTPQQQRPHRPNQPGHLHHPTTGSVLQRSGSEITPSMIHPRQPPGVTSLPSSVPSRSGTATPTPTPRTGPLTPPTMISGNNNTSSTSVVTTGKGDKEVVKRQTSLQEPPLFHAAASSPTLSSNLRQPNPSSSTPSSPRNPGQVQDMPVGPFPGQVNPSTLHQRRPPNAGQVRPPVRLETLQQNQLPASPKTTLDRLMDWIIGDGADYTLPMICERCQGYNGLIHKDAAPTMFFVCQFCHYYNQRGEQSPQSPRSPPSPNNDFEVIQQQLQQQHEQAHQSEHDQNPQHDHEHGSEHEGDHDHDQDQGLNGQAPPSQDPPQDVDQVNEQSATASSQNENGEHPPQ